MYCDVDRLSTKPHLSLAFVHVHGAKMLHGRVRFHFNAVWWYVGSGTLFLLINVYNKRMTMVIMIAIIVINNSTLPYLFSSIISFLLFSVLVVQHVHRV